MNDIQLMLKYHKAQSYIQESFKYDRLSGEVFNIKEIYQVNY